MKPAENKNIYLDNASTTPIAPIILRHMYSYDQKFYANPSSLYKSGDQARLKINEMRKKLAGALQAKQQEIIFTSGGSEGNNIALFGVVGRYLEENSGQTPHIIVSSIEHASVLDVARALEERGVTVTYIKPRSNGIVKVSDIIESILPNTILVSLMLVNNELGTVQQVGKLAREIAKYRKVNASQYPYLHSDACQAGNYFLITAPRLGADLVTINASKVYGPKGVGALYIRGGVKLTPFVYGGGQERGLRSGTENVSAIIGMTESFVLAQELRESETRRLVKLRDYCLAQLISHFEGSHIWGDLKERSPNNISVYIPNCNAEELVIRLSALGVCVSSKSACSSIDSDGSYVILAIGGTDIQARQTLRITMGRKTQKSHIDYFLKTLKKIVKEYT